MSVLVFFSFHSRFLK